jgi:dihydrofolate reductase
MGDIGDISRIKYWSPINMPELGPALPKATIIVAYSTANRAIADKDGNIPWQLPEDMKHFKETTKGCPCIMGRKTWESLPDQFKPLPGRPNFILTRSPEQYIQEIDTKYPVVRKQKMLAFAHLPPIHLAQSIERAIEFCRDVYPGKEVFIIGGAEIYDEALRSRLCKRIIASEVRLPVDRASARFPQLNNWNTRKILKECDKFDIVEYTLL